MFFHSQITSFTGMCARKRKTKKALSVVDDDITVYEEEMPLPYVHYPGSYATFIAFSEHENSEQWKLCECSRAAVDNQLRLLKQQPKTSYSFKKVTAPLTSHHFPAN